MEIPFSLSSAPGVNAQENAGRVINAYPEKTEVGSPNQVIYRRAPGIDLLCTVADHSHCRGFLAIDSTLLTVLDQRVVAVGQSGETFFSTDLGAFDGERPVTIARNNASPAAIVAVDLDNGCKNLFETSGPTDFADTDLPASPLSVSHLRGYFVWTFANGRIWASDLNSVNVATNSFTDAPGPLVTGRSFRGEFFAMGTNFIQPYRDAGTSPFPLEPSISGGGVIPRGIIGPFSVAGYEEGWSNEFCWVGDDNVVYKLDGYSGTRISKHSVERAVETSTARSAIECSVAMSGGHAFLFVKSPGEWTWVHDLTTGEWQERMSFNADDFRASCSVKAFDRWIVGDEETGKIGELTAESLDEFGDPLAFELQSGVPATFPSKGIVARADFNFSVSVGNTAVPDPIVQISWSRDGGRSWGNPVNRKLGMIGASHQRVSVQRVGLFGAQGIRFKVRVSDAVHVGFKGGQMALMPLAT